MSYALHLRDRVGAVHDTGSAQGPRRSRSSPAGRCGSRTTTSRSRSTRDHRSRRMTGISHFGVFVEWVVPREHESVALDVRDRCATSPCGWCAGCKGCSCRRRRRRTASRETGTGARRRCTVPPYARCAPRCGQNASWRWNSPARSRHRTSSRFQYSSAVTSPGARSLGERDLEPAERSGEREPATMPCAGF